MKRLRSPVPGIVLRGAVLATLLSGFVAVPAVHPLADSLIPFGPAVAAAANGVDVRGSTTYTVLPDEHVVAVSAVVTVRNVKPSTTTQRFYFTSYGLGIHPGAREITALHGDEALPLTTAERTTAEGQPYLEVRVTFHRQVFYAETYAFRLDYKLPDAGPRSPTPVRVGQAFAGFYAYAYGEEGAEVRIVFPAGFKVVTRQGSTLASSAGPGGSLVLDASGISSPSSWWSYVGAERSTGLRTEAFDLQLEGERHRIEVKSWAEDRRWAAIVRDRLSRGLPVMGTLIGQPWPVDDTLEVSEVFTPLLGGYAGIFYETTDEIRITEAADELTVLHEASHAWFDGGLIGGRWMNEGLADEYASRTLGRLGARNYGPEPVRRESAIAFPLNAWPDPATIDDATGPAREAYGYNASWRVVRDLLDEIGEARMRDVFAAARDRAVAYRGEGPAELLPISHDTVDWRVFLDLLEERGGSETATHLFERWVVTPQELPLLDDRRAARAAYRQLGIHARDWSTPLPVRMELATWDFVQARDLIRESEELLRLRDRVDRLSNAVGAEPSARLERAYETADDAADLTDAKLLAGDQLLSLGEISQAAELLARDRDPLTNLGLLSEAPGEAIGEARTRFEADDQVGARASARRAVQLLNDAPARGRERAVVVGGGLAIAFVLAVILGIRLGRRRRGAVATIGGTLPRQGEPPTS